MVVKYPRHKNNEERNLCPRRESSADYPVAQPVTVPLELAGSDCRTVISVLPCCAAAEPDQRTRSFVMPGKHLAILEEVATCLVFLPWGEGGCYIKL
jgi:hypothetical protein